MCDPATIALIATTAVSAGISLFGGGNKSTTVNNTTTTPPTAVLPTAADVPAPTARAAGADVRLGAGSAADVRTGSNTKKTTPATSTTTGAFTETRKAATVLGGLGRAGLAL